MGGPQSHVYAHRSPNDSPPKLRDTTLRVLPRYVTAMTASLVSATTLFLDVIRIMLGFDLTLYLTRVGCNS